MVVLDWLKPAVIFGSVLYAFIGVAGPLARPSSSSTR